ncbi:restriction endonuclease subunit S [Paenibacillus sp. MB22_1]|uniref:Type I restriction-modification system, specificity subunit S n=1 Tax=Heyndrickxia coagulans TaxID=1398 RepID=A0A150KJN5_HEYCO|nr:restriction endonuclease subunit S [Heyndrickxia coagulans]KYC73661.1 Type I restriction-modification system, specificity subunit S [Heyndrickxia coagulans]
MVNGWKSVSLLDCGEILQGLTYRPDNVKPYGLLVLRSSNIQDEKLVFDDCVFVDCNVDEKQYVRKGDIVICVRNGSSALIGKCALVDADYKATFGAFMSVFRGENSDYIFQVFRSTIVQKQIRSNSNATINQITKTDFENIVIPVPSDASEQRAIAEALSDVDSYIALLEKLIAKKKAIKQGAMQELLTGKRRLPGFDGGWGEKPLGELFDFFGGFSASRAQLSTVGYSYLHYGDIHGTNRTFVDVCSDSSIPRLNTSLTKVSPTALLQNGDVVFVDASEDDEGASRHVVVRNIEGKPFISGLHTIIARAKTGELDNLFKEFCFQTENIRSQFKYYAVGTKVTGVNKVSIAKINLYFPTSKEEQSAIAAILSDMDSEIEALTAKLHKAKLIKKGMMQELLTGRIRLVQSEAAAVVTEKPELQVAATSSAQKGHNRQFDDAVMIAGIVNAFYSARYPLGRKKIQKLLYLLRRKQDESTVAFKKKSAGPYADEVRYKGGEPIAKSNSYIDTTTTKGIGTTFTKGKNIGQALDYIERWGRHNDIQWLAEKFRYTSVDDLELLATVDMAICDLEEAGTPVSVASIKHLIATNKEWQAKLQKKTFADSKIAKAISDLQTLF